MARVQEVVSATKTQLLYSGPEVGEANQPAWGLDMQHQKISILLVFALLGAVLSPVAVHGGAPPTLTVTGVSPNTATTNGGGDVTISGTGFSGTTVLFGSVPATSVTVDSSSQLTVEVPPNSAGGVTITVTNSDGTQATLTNGFTYSAAAAPTVSSLSINSGSTNGGTSVTATGSGFHSTGSIKTLVQVGGVLARNVVVNSASSVTFDTPANEGGAASVVFENPDGKKATLTNGFTFVAPAAPSISSLDLAQGPSNGGTTVVISGTGFVTSGPNSPIVTFGGNVASITSASSSSITVTTPANPAGVVDVAVSNPDGQRHILQDAFIYTASTAPDATSITPTTFNTFGGTEFTIMGTGFHSDATVTIGGVPASDLAVTGSTTITGTAPPHASGTVNAVVSNPDGQSDTLTNVVTYERPLEVDSVSPTTGTKNGGNSVTLSGVGLPSGATVFVDFDDDGELDAGEEVLSTSGSGSSLTLRMPARADAASSGPFDVVAIAPDGRTASLTAAYAYTDANAPAIGAGASDISNPSGNNDRNGGQSVTIKGTDFATGTGNKPTVLFGPAQVDADDVTVTSSTSITVKTPPCGVTCDADGTVDVTVTNPDGQSDTRTGGFTYDESSLTAAPSISSVSDPSGTNTRNGGQTVTITGSSMKPGLTATVDGKNADILSLTGSTSLKIKTPACGGCGTVSVVVTNPDGQSSAPGTFTYEATPAPTATSLDVTSGSTLGRTTVKITGTNFDSNAHPTVTFGGTAGEVTGVTSTVVTVKTPANTLGAKNVVVTNPSGQSASITNGFTYTSAGAPIVTGVEPATGLLSGGTDVTISGFNFGHTVSSVTINGDNATDIEVVDVNTITARTPAGIAGPQDVEVVNVDSQSGERENGFEYLPAAPRLDLTSTLSEDSGSSVGGTPVTINGDALTGVVVTFGGDLAQITGGSGTQSMVLSPANAAGDVDIMVMDDHGQSATLEDGFTYFTAEAPTVTTVQPGSGQAPGGTMVTIVGTGFSTTAGLEPTVAFGNAFATDVTVTNAQTITAVTPARSAGLVTVTVENPDGQDASLVNGYKFLGVGGPPAPSISGIDPASGPSNGGTTVTIAGSNFQAGATVKFGGTAATVVSVTSSSISATTPAHAPGDVDVVVTNPDLQSATLVDGFDYSADPAPTIDDVSPATGPAGGGTSITITGTGFQSGLTVTVGGATATVGTVSATSITATTPAGSAGAKNVVVTNPDSQSVTSAGAFTYTGTTTTTTSTTTTSTSTQTQTQTNTQTNTGTSTQTSTGTGTSTSTSTSTGGTGTPTAAQIKAYNNRIDVEVEETDDGNLVKFDLPSSAPATVQGVQIWYRNSPWQHAASLDDSSQAFQDGEYLHSGEDAQSDTEYLVTAYYALSSAGGHFAQPGSTPSEEDYPEGQGAGDGGLPLWAWLLIFLGGLLLLGLLIAIIVAASRGRDDEDEGDWSPGTTSAAWTSQESGWEEAPTQEEAGDDGHDTHHIKCPSCDTRFTAVGERPLVTHCPGCGKKGVLN